jgi:hypothetical protein
MKYVAKNRSQIFGFRLFPETSVLFKKQASGAFFWRQGSLIPFCEIFGL